MKNYITETWLREHGAMTEGVELCLPAGSCLTPAARSLISDRRLQIKYAGEKQSSSPDGAAVDLSVRPAIHPLTGRNRSEGRHAMQCALCHQNVERKPDVLTHLDANTLVAKNDLRIKFRGRLDSAIAWAVLTQAEWAKQAVADASGISGHLEHGLADVRSCLGNVLRAEVTGDPLVPIHMGPHDAEAIHRLSHDPWKHLGHDHLVPEVAHGLPAAQLNLLRAAIREAEVMAAEIYIDRDFAVLRPDIMQGLNRLSSAVYVLMIMAAMRELGVALKEGAWN